LDLTVPETVRNPIPTGFTEAGTGIEEYTGEGAEKIMKTYLKFTPVSASFVKDYGTWGDK